MKIDDICCTNATRSATNRVAMRQEFEKPRCIPSIPTISALPEHGLWEEITNSLGEAIAYPPMSPVNWLGVFDRAANAVLGNALAMGYALWATGCQGLILGLHHQRK
jgi:hypothetical protein